MREVAQRASLFLLSEEKNWNTPPELEYFFNETHFKGLRATYDIKLPSQQQVNEESFRISPGNARFELMWQSHAPQYKNDLDTYIWQSFRSRPQSDWASISILDNRAPRDIRMILILKDEASMRDLRKQRKILPSQRHYWSATSELNAALQAIFSLATSGLVTFLKEAWVSIGNLTFEARRKPRIEKVQYLLHLKDCVECAKNDIRQNLSQLEEMAQYLIGLARLNPEIHHNTFERKSYKDDFTYLQDEMKKLGETIERLQKEARPSVRK
ncbi:MAG: hypothetical protein OHK93_008766 [Ramalina farinacea]|uniref:Uncharacterized protein n=1 Tax=Ramalina farinacea TaxID=258253 RepID=A0AA43QP38_9LECA|nr:hypothetical protein [Ramalina farinacea]